MKTQTTFPWTFLLGLFIVLVQQQALVVNAWGKVGHELVGNLAWELLNADAQADLRDLLGNDNNDDDDDTLSPLGAVADWADQVRHSHDYAWSGPLHYIDIRDDLLPLSCFATNRDRSDNDNKTPATCAFDWTRDCGNDFCVVGALQNYTHRLVATHTQDAQVEAVKFITHFVGDLHQPLHVSKSTDRGGNNIPVHVHFAKATKSSTTTKSYLRSTVQNNRHYDTERRTHESDLTTTTTMNANHPAVVHQSTNLHGVWDYVLLETYQKEACGDDWMTLQTHVYQVIRDASDTGDLEQWIQCADGGRHVCLDDWAQESWTLALHAAYVHAHNGTQIQPHDVLPREYYETNLPVVLEQLAKASVRLAWTLSFHLTRRRYYHVET